MLAPSDRTGTRTSIRRWRTGAAFAGVALTLLACGHLWATSTTPVPAAPRDVYACVLAQVTDLGYKTVVDTGNPGRRNLDASRELSLAERGPDPTVLTRRDVLQVLVTRDESGASSTLRITAGTISRHNDRRGITEVNEAVNPKPRHDAEAIATHCRTAPAPQTSLPASS